MIIPTREASKIQQIHTLLVDQGFRISVGEGNHWVLQMHKKNRLERRKTPSTKNPLLILGREDEKGGGVGDGHDLVEGVHRGLPLDLILLKLPLVI